MAENMVLARDDKGKIAFGFNITTKTYDFTLAAGADTSIDISALIADGYNHFLINCYNGGQAWVGNTAPTAPNSTPTLLEQFTPVSSWYGSLANNGFTSGTLYFRGVIDGNVQVILYRNKQQGI